jgi:hypothetical protein
LNTGNYPEDEKQECRNPSGLWVSLINIVDSYAAYNRERAKPHNDPYAGHVAKWTKINGIATCAAAFLAGVAAFVFWQQLGAMQQQVEDERTATIEANRAVVSPTQTFITADHKVGKPITAVFTYDNVGRLPANDIKESFHFDVVTRPPDHDALKIPAPEGSACKKWPPRRYAGMMFPSPIGSGTGMQGDETTDSDKVYWASEMNDGSKLLRVRVCMQYVTFNTTYSMEYCRIYAVEKNGIILGATCNGGGDHAD